MSDAPATATRPLIEQLATQLANGVVANLVRQIAVSYDDDLRRVINQCYAGVGLAALQMMAAFDDAIPSEVREQPPYQDLRGEISQGMGRLVNLLQSVDDTLREHQRQQRWRATAFHVMVTGTVLVLLVLVVVNTLVLAALLHRLLT